MFSQIFVFPLCGMVPIGLYLAVTFVETPSPKGNYAPVNGLKMYYEIHGKANDKNPPLVLLHGGVGATEMFGPNLPALSKTRQVIAADLQSHGRTADIDRPLSIELMADDVAALIKHLGIEKADVMGYSLGGGVALQTAIRYPGAVRKLVVVSAAFKRDGWYPEILAGKAQMGPAAAEPMKQTPMYQLYSKIAPKAEDWPVLLTNSASCSRRTMTGRNRSPPSRRPRCSLSAMPMPCAPRIAWNSSGSSAAASVTAVGTAPGVRMPSLPFCPAQRTTTFSCRPRWHRPPRNFSTRPCRIPSKHERTRRKSHGLRSREEVEPQERHEGTRRG